MKLVQIKGQVEPEGLEKSAKSSEKLRVQEEVLTAQMNLQQNKIILLAASYDYLIKTKELREKSPAKISESTQRGTVQMQGHIENASAESKIFPNFNEVDFIRFVKILENFRPNTAIALESSLDFLRQLTELAEKNREEIIYWLFVLMEEIFDKLLAGAQENLEEFKKSK